MTLVDGYTIWTNVQSPSETLLKLQNKAEPASVQHVVRAFERDGAVSG